MYNIEKHDFVIVGDFNIHLDRQTPETKRIIALLDDHNLTQHVHTSTHKHGHILDWVITSEHIAPTAPVSIIDKCISDHHLLLFSLPLSKKKKAKIQHHVTTRNIKDINMIDFKADLVRELSSIQEMSAEALDRCSRKVLDKHAPLKSKCVKLRKPSPWYNAAVKRAKGDKRRAEAKWRKTKLCIDREIYIMHKNKYKHEVRRAKAEYFLEKICNVRDSKQFFRLTNSLLGKDTVKELPSRDDDKELAERFSHYFIQKVTTIRESLDQYAVETEHSQFNGVEMSNFVEVGIDDIKSMILSSPNKSCDLDPIPTGLLKACLEEIAQPICYLVNNSLRTGVFPEIFKTAIVTPLLKKTGLDTDNLRNYRPVSNLLFISKLLERVVLKQVRAHMLNHNLLEPFQSAYRQGHSTETALIRVIDDLQNVIDRGDTSILCLLDLSSAFDTIDHKLLLHRLQSTFGFTGHVLNWFESYLTNRMQIIKIGNDVSDTTPVPFGVPQGSVLGPVLFTLYTAPLGKIVRNHSLSYHLYADDSQIYNTTNTKNDFSAVVEKCALCIDDVKTWTCRNRLKLNGDKTEVLIIGSKNNLQKLKTSSISIDNSNIPFVNNVKNLGTTLDSHLEMKSHVRSLKKSLLFQLKKISSIRNCLTRDACKYLVTSIIFSKLDYCNSLLFGTTSENIKHLQGIQNNAARLIYQQKRRDDATPLLARLHWLPVQERIKFKAAVMAYTCVTKSAPCYLQELCTIYSPPRSLRSSADDCLLSVPRIQRKAGERSFSHFGPVTWNQLPLGIRKSPSLNVFKSRLKTFYFQEVYA